MTDTACKGDSNWKQYAVHAPDVPIEKIAEFNEYKEELMADPPVQEMPVQSMITSPGMCQKFLYLVKSLVQAFLVEAIFLDGTGFEPRA